MWWRTTQKLDYAWVCSEPKKIGVRRIGLVTKERDRALKEAPKRRVVDVAREVTESVLSLRGGELDGLPEIVRGRTQDRRAQVAVDSPEAEEAGLAAEEILVAREMARVGLGVEFVLAQSRE